MIKHMFATMVMAIGITVSVQATDLKEPQAIGFEPEKLAALEQHFQNYVDTNKLVGLTTLVSRRGKLVHVKSYGSLDIETGRPVRDDTIFRIYSMTKPVTSVAMMMLWEEGKFKLDDPVAKYIPAFKGQRVFSGLEEDGTFQTVPAKREMTIRDLMRHTAGLTYGLFSDTPVDRAYRGAGIFAEENNLAKRVDILGKQPLLYHPGDAWVYSLATDVQGRLVEILSGQALDVFFRNRIFQPLGMKDTGFQVREDQKDRLVEIYALDKEKGLVPYRGDAYQDFTKKPTSLSGGGGLASTALDYWRFAQMMANGGVFEGVRLLKASTIDLISTDQLPSNLNGIAGGKMGLGFGFNVAVVKDIAKLDSAGRNGEYFWGGAANTLFWIDPEEEVVAMMLTNILPPDLYPFRKDMRRFVYDAIID